MDSPSSDRPDEVGNDRLSVAPARTRCLYLDLDGTLLGQGRLAAARR